MRIEKRDYSNNPWRLVTSDGREVWMSRFFEIGRSGKIDGPVCGRTKKDCANAALRILETLLLENVR